MSGSIYKSGAGAILQQMRLEVYSNNLANVNTSGFKADQPVFRFDQAEVPAETAPDVARLSPYALPLEYVTNFESGPLTTTGNPLDVAIVGNGFFEVQTPDGLQYTRNGHLSINAEGVLSTTEGWPIMGQGGEINIDGSRVEINDSGEISVDGDVVGALKVTHFSDPTQLRKNGSTMFKPVDANVGQIDPGEYRITQGAVEASNVNAIRTMTEIIETLRVFESYQKVIQATDNATSKTVNEVGRIA